MRNIILASILAFSFGYVAANLKPNQQNRNRNATALQLRIGDTVDLSTNGMEDGKNYLRKLVVEKRIGIDNKPIATKDKLEERQQEWTILVGTGDERHGIVLVNQR